MSGEDAAGTGPGPPPGDRWLTPDPGDPALSPTGRVQRPVVLMVLDGWGCAPAGPGNAVSLASTPVFDGLLAAYPQHEEMVTAFT